MKSTIKLSFITLIAAAGAAFIPAAQAQSGEQLSSPPDYSNLRSERNRAEVRSEAIAAQRTGQAWSGEQASEPYDNDEFKSEKTRAQVVAETRAAIRLGLTRHGGEADPTAH